MKKITFLLMALLATCTLWAGNVITYTASAKLTETTNDYSSGLHTNAFNNSITGHTFSNGKGTITFAGNVTSIGDCAFMGCSGLTSVVIPNSVTSIGEDAFFKCSGLTSVTIPNSVTSIGGSAFMSCTGLTSVTIPNSVTSIGGSAFNGCTGLTSVTIPNSVTSIGDYAFYSCSGFTSIIVEKGNKKYDSRENCNAIIETATNKLVAGCNNTTIPNSVTSIGDWAFYGCSGLTSVTIPNSVTSIGNRAFSDCSGLTSMTIPNSVTSVGWSAFAGCTGLTSITIPNSVTSIESGAFGDCTGLTSVTIPNSVTSIGDYAFNSCTGLTSVTIPNSVTSIGGRAFYGCSGLTSVTIGNSVASIEEEAFYGCSNIDDIYSYAKVPPTIDGDDVFHNVSQHAVIHVPEGTIKAYQKAIGWSKFLHFYEMSELPEGTPTNSVGVTVSDNYATFTWPINPTASSYTLTITKDGEVFCSLIFNPLGQLVGMAFAPARNAASTSAEHTAYGFAFVVRGLENGNYDYTFTANDSEENIIETYQGSFTTEAITALEGVNMDLLKANGVDKFYHNGTIYIRRNDKIYNINGIQVE